MAGYSGPLMSHNPQMRVPCDGRSIMAKNKTKTMNAPFQNQHLIYNQLSNISPQMSKKDSNYFCRSHATSFHSAGLSHLGKHYARDMNTGTWFKHIEDRHAELHDSRSSLAYRYTESKQNKGDGAKTYTIWAAPCSSGFWKEPMAKPEKACPFGYVNGPVQSQSPIDAKDMPDPLGPLSRTSGAPNFLPQTQGRRVTSTMAKSGSSPMMAKSPKASLASTM